MTKSAERIKGMKHQAIAYFEAGASVPDAARATGIGLSTLYAWRRTWREHGVTRLLDRPQRHGHVELSEQEAEVLDGLMLGDGFLELGKNSRNPCLRITRTATDLEYIRWTADVFAERLTANAVSVGAIYDARTHREYQRATLRTRCDPAFLGARHRWYPDGRKVVPHDLTLSATTVAVWLADDGSVGRASRRSPDIKFATHGFSETEVRRLAGLLSSRYTQPFSVYEDQGHFTIRGFGAAAKALLRDIDPEFPHLDRKSDLWRKTELLTDRVPPPPCPRCSSERVHRWTRTRTGVQQFKCLACGRAFREFYQREGRDPRRKKEASD